MAFGKIFGIVLALALLTTSAFAVTITGTVTYRERIALPDGADLRVTLVDLATGTPVAGAMTAIPHQVPIGFALNVHRTLDADAAYGLVAEISGQRAVIFRSAEPAPVDISSTDPVRVLVRHDPAPLAEPAPEIATPPAGLVDVVWTVTSIGGDPVQQARPLTLSIAADLRAGGHGGCNSYFTEATVDGSHIAFGPAAATRMACAASTMSEEAAFFAALAAVTSYEIEGKGLRLLDPAGVPLVGLVNHQE